MNVRVSAFGGRGFLVEPADESASTAWVLAVAERCRRTWPQAEVIPGLASVLVARPVPPGSHSRFAEQLRGALDLHPGGLAAADGPAASGAEHLIPVRYDGPDLASLAAHLDVPAPELVSRHLATTWTVAAIGFSPGFGYLTCTDPLFADVPRRAQPRTRVPAGSVALAAGMCAVYPSATPGGWQLIGTTDVVMFDPGAQPPARLSVGDVVRFSENG